MMSDATPTPIGYAAAADSYWQAGWRAVLPLPAAAKKNPPAVYCDRHRPRATRQGTMSCPDCTHYSGYAGVDPSYPDIMAWTETFTGGNLCLRMPDGVIGIDVDGYGAKTGVAALQEAVNRWGALPLTTRSTSREDDPISGIRFFRVPPGTLLEQWVVFPDLGIGDIEIIQRHHRYAVVWPSIHPEGRTYWWRNDDMQMVGIPRPDELPWLPQAWLDALKVTPRALSVDAASYDVRAAMTEGEPLGAVRERVRQAMRELNLPGASRHDTTMRHVLALLRLGKNGQPGVNTALEHLCSVFVAVVTSDGSRNADEARLEFDRMITNDNAAKELAQPGVLDWMQSMITDEVRDSPKGEDPVSEPERAHTETGSITAEPTTTVDPSSTLAVAALSRVEEIESGFWDSRESLRAIFETSMLKMVAPWAVLGQCAARALTLVRPCVVLPDLIGGPGSLNLFVAVVAPSGGGKGASSAVARLLVPDVIDTANIGSGEGLLKAFQRSKDDAGGDGGSKYKEALMITVDEVDSLAAMNQRSASTTLPILRQGFSGETLGFSYATAGKGHNIPAHSYRMTMVVAVQPLRAGGLLGDGGGGTPQRFMWFPATDRRIKRMKRTWPPGALQLPPNTEWMYPRTLEIPQEAIDVLEQSHVDRQNGLPEALDGHALFCREKFAFALTVLDGRTEMTAEDWELSGIAAEVSTMTREGIIETIQEAARIDAVERGDVKGVENAAARASQELEEAERMRNALRWALEKIREAGDEGIPQRDLDRKSAKHTRRLLPTALRIGREDGLIRQVEGTTSWVLI